jgi:glycosyltransferase involved in cell wall biosynthesis
VNGSHYDLRDQFAALARSGAAIDVYPNRDAPDYRELAARTPGMRVMNTLPPAELLRALADYDVGWAAFNTGVNGAHLDTALPNKAFEYLAAGLPIVAGRHRALACLVDEYRVGIVIDDPGELVGRLRPPDLAELRQRVATQRHRFTVESQIERLVDLYDQTLRDRGGPRSIAAIAAAATS